MNVRVFAPRNTVGAGCVLFILIAGFQTLSSLADEAAGDAETTFAPGDVHLKNSRVYIHVGKTGLGHDHAVVGLLKSGTLLLGASENAGQMEFDLTSFRADSDGARKYIGLQGSSDAGTRQQVDANMLGAAVLNVARFPTATFVIASAAPVKKASQRGLPQYQLTGNFTLHGVTRQIQFLADSESKDGWVHLRGSFSILQSQFGIQPFTKAFGAIGVADRLSIWGDLWIAEQAKATVEGAGSAPRR
ncbi:MAG: YceI family protein [Planctomycetaceae bacterium]|nr:YceI family protein [Planctomycetaceae bacterium]